MSKQGTLVIVKEGNNFRPKIEFKGKKLDIKVDRLSKPLGEAYQNSPESVQGKAVVFDRDKNGTPIRITESGKIWERPGEPVPASARNSVAMSAAPGGRITTVNNVTPGGLDLSNGDHPSKRDIDICELKASLNKPVVKRDGKWMRSDYQCEKPNCYPFNFAAAPKAHKQAYTPVPEVNQDPKTTKDLVSRFFKDNPHLDHGRFALNTHTGMIEVELTALSPLIVSHPPGRDGILSEKEQEALLAVYTAAKQNAAYGDTEIDGKPTKPATRDEKMQRIRPPYQVGSGQYALPATSLKGMIRSMVEAYSHSLMGAISDCLRGDKKEGNADLYSRTPPWRHSPHIANKNDVTLYTYEWRGQKGSGTWQRWVAKGNTPWDKLSHVNPEANPLRLSLADAMFGRVFQKTKEVKSALPALRGRIRISEAVGWNDSEKSTVKVAEDYWFLKSLTRPSGAKAKCEALYLLPDKSGKVAEYGDPASEARGRKMYWPHSLGDASLRGAKPLAWMRDEIAAKAQKELWQDAEFNAAVEAFQERVRGHKESQASTKSWVKPLLPGSTFRFSIRFENLTSVELGALLKAVELENKADPATHCHRLGRAKPLGFGSVTLSIKAINLWDARQAAANLKPAEEFWVNDAKKDAMITTARDKFADFCKTWKAPVWEDIADLTAIPTGLTDLDYWKNWSDYQPWKNKNHPLPLPRDAKP